MTDLRPSIESALDAFGVDVVVTPPGDGPVVRTRAFWLPSDATVGDIRRADAVHILVLPLAGLPEVPRLTVITAPEWAGGPVADWRVDEARKPDFDHYQVVVKPAPAVSA